MNLLSPLSSKPAFAAILQTCFRRYPPNLLSPLSSKPAFAAVLGGEIFVVKQMYV